MPPLNHEGMALTIVETPAVTGGVDTRADAHVAAALDSLGGLLGTESFPTTPAGYRDLLIWLRALGPSLWWGSRGRAATGPASPDTWPQRGSGLSRSIDPTAKTGAAPASPTRSTR